MFIVWGKKIVFRKLGFIGDYCPVCHGSTPFYMQRKGLAGHVYYISFGEGKLVGYQRTCQDCGIALAANPATYATISKQPYSIRELLPMTFPDFANVRKGVLAMEDRLQKNPTAMPAAERRTVINDAFALFAPQVENVPSTNIDKMVGLAFVSFFVLPLMGLIFVEHLAPRSQDLALIVTIAASAILLAWSLFTSRSRYIRKHITPMLAKTLRPLKPSAAEIQPVLDYYQQLKAKIGTQLKLADLMRELETDAT